MTDTDLDPIAASLSLQTGLPDIAAGRAALQRGDFAQVEALLARCRQQDIERGGSGAWERLIGQLLQHWMALPALIALLARWTQQYPRSYYAWLALGGAWQDAASTLRSARCADRVDAAQWIGAGLARDQSVAALFNALQCDPGEIAAWHRLMQITCYLGEPDWLLDQQLGRQPDPPGTGQDPAAWEAGLALVAPFGGALATVPALPACLAPRLEHEFEDGKTYWLRQALAVAPLHVAVLADYLYFLYPRWGGSHEQMQAFIEGPLCKGLSEAERDYLRFVKEEDWIRLHGTDADTLDQAQRTLDHWLAREVSPRTRARVLSCCSNHLSDSARSERGDEVIWDRVQMQKAYDQLVELFILEPQSFASQHFDTLECCVAFAGIEDTHQLVAHSLRLDEMLRSSGICQLWLLVARQFALGGLEPGPAPTPDEVLLALRVAEEEDLDVACVAGNLYADTHLAGGIALFELLVNAGHAASMAALADIYRVGARPSRCGLLEADPARSEQLLQQAAEAGDPTGLFNWGLKCAQAFERDGAVGQRTQALRCYRRAADIVPPYHQIWGCAMKNIAGLLWHGDESERRECITEVLRQIWMQDDTALEVWAAGSYAEAFLDGLGTAPNRWLASIWLERALERAPQDASCHHLLGRLKMHGQWLSSLRSRRAIERDRKRCSEEGWHITFGDTPFPHAQ